MDTLMPSIIKYNDINIELTINFTIYFPFIFSFIATVALLLKIILNVKNNQISKKVGQTNYTIYVLLITSFSATILTYGLMSFFNISGGHGYGHIAILVFHMFFSSILILLGRIIIGWKYIEY